MNWRRDFECMTFGHMSAVYGTRWDFDETAEVVNETPLGTRDFMFPTSHAAMNFHFYVLNNWLPNWESVTRLAEEWDGIPIEHSRKVPEVETLRDAFFEDRTVTNEEYGRMVEEAQERARDDHEHAGGHETI